MTRKLFISVLSLLLLVTFQLPNEAAAKKVTGVPKAYEKEINYLIDKGIVEGKSNGDFDAKAVVDRAQAVVMIGRSIGLDGKQRKTKFSDVSKSHYASGFIASADEKNITNGAGGGKFKPERSLTRAEMASFIARAFKLTDKTAVNYSDVSKSHPHYEDIAKITNAGISNGTGKGFNPDKTITREEFAVMVARALEPSFKVEQEKPNLGSMYIKPKGDGTHITMYEKPDLNSTQIGWPARNTKVTVHKKEGSWYEITSDTASGKRTGFVQSNLLSDKPVSTPKPPTEPKPPEKTDLKGFTIAVDAGHGGSDPGASGNGITEKDYTLAVSKKLQKELENRGAKVIMTRKNDTYVALDERAKIANNAKADIFVSVHLNSFSAASADGTETYYHKNSKEGKKLAEEIQKELVKALDTKDRGAKIPPGGGFAVLNRTSMPAVLAELGFLTNKEDAKILKAKQSEAAKAISKGIGNYLLKK